jgi:mono/diheme cytochrome c family protein
MNRKIRSGLVLVVVGFLASVASFALSEGEAVYKSKCLNCHGANGVATSGIGSLMKVKSITDPEVKKCTRLQMIEATRNGVARMQGYKSELTDQQIKDAVDYFRSFIK